MVPFGQGQQGLANSVAGTKEVNAAQRPAGCLKVRKKLRVRDGKPAERMRVELRVLGHEPVGPQIGQPGVERPVEAGTTAKRLRQLDRLDVHGERRRITEKVVEERDGLIHPVEERQPYVCHV